MLKDYMLFFIEKAFDKLNWTFIQKSLEHFGFGKSLRKWVHILYKNAESCILNNGTTSKYFPIKSGVRQGCPLSAFLFVIAVEILAINIRNNDAIAGIEFGDKTFKITQLADDMTLFLRNIDSLSHVFEVVTWFKDISGLSLNKSKTDILQIGAPLNFNETLFNIRWEKERIYALGTWFYKDYQKSIKHTYEARLELLETTIKVWSQRNLTWIGKITVIKSLCIAKINYAISSIEPPDWFIDSVVKMLEKFLWSNKPARVKNQVMQNDYENGGLRMINVKHYLTAQKTNWIKQLLNNQNTVPCSYICMFIDMSLENFLKSSINPCWLPKKLPQFYKDIFYAWFSMKPEPVAIADIQREIIWNNRFIMIENKGLFNQRLYANGLIFINDIIDKNGNFIPYQLLTARYGPHITEYTYMCLKHAIPKTWRHTLLTCQVLTEMEPHHETVYLKTKNTLKPVKLLKSKEIYWILNNNNISLPNCVNKWFEKYFIDFSNSKWKQIFTLTKSITGDTKLIEFQFKIIHRAYASDSYVANFDNTVSKMCTQCLLDNNIPHLFVDCIKVQKFWTDLQNWLNSIGNMALALTTRDIIFGIVNSASFMINFCILHAKWYIHLNKKEDIVCFANFWQYLQNVLKVEHELANSCKNMKVYVQNLEPLASAIV